MDYHKRINSIVAQVGTYCYYLCFAIIVLLSLACCVAFVVGEVAIAVRLGEGVIDFIDSMVVFMVVVMWVERKS